MELNKITKITHYVDINDLTKYLTEKLGRRVEYGDSSNNTDYSIDVEKEEIADYDQEYVDDFLDIGYLNMDFGWRIALTYCANQNWLEEGSYVIRVSW